MAAPLGYVRFAPDSHTGGMVSGSLITLQIRKAVKSAAFFSTIFQAARRARSLASAFTAISRAMIASISSPVRMPRSISASTRAWTISMFARISAAASASQYAIRAATAGDAATATLANALASI